MKIHLRYNNIRSLPVFCLALMLFAAFIPGGVSARADCSPPAMTERSCCVAAVAACTCTMPASVSGASLAVHHTHTDSLAPVGLVCQPPPGCPCAASPAPVERTPVTEPTRLLMTVAPTRAPAASATPLSHCTRFRIADESVPHAAPRCLTSPRAPPFQA